jgi:hypothetical protein
VAFTPVVVEPAVPQAGAAALRQRPRRHRPDALLERDEFIVGNETLRLDRLRPDRPGAYAPTFDATSVQATVARWRGASRACR